MFSKMQNLSPFFPFKISKQEILFFKNKKMGMLTDKKIEFRYLNWRDLHENYYAISQLNMLAVAMLHLEFGPPSRTNRECKGERVIKWQNSLSSGYFRSKGPCNQPIRSFA